MPDPVVRLALPAMATRFELVLAGGDPVRLRAIGEAALAAVAECEARLSPFVRGSAIARCNAGAAEAPVRVDPQTFDLLLACRTLHAASRGAFDPTVGPLLAALGFRGTPAADAAGLADARAAVGMQHVALDERAQTVHFLRPGMALDLGAVGKGEALDEAAAVLREHGVAAALLHGGTSSVLAIGAPPGLPGFRIGIGAAPGPAATLRDLALSVSRPDGRVARTRSGAPLGHVVDPRTGEALPARPALCAVLAPSARTADAWSTALLVDPALPLPSGTAALSAPSPSRWSARGDLAAAFHAHAPTPTASAIP